MQLAAVRWVADLLRDPATGVAAVIAAGVPSQPDTIELQPVPIYDETRDSWIAWGTYPQSIRAKGPALMVRAVGASESDRLPNNKIETARVAVHVVVPSGADGPTGKDMRLQAAFLLRVAKRVIAAPALLEEVTSHNPVVWGCTITPPQDSAFLYQPMYEPEVLQGGALIDALVIAVSLDDPWANGFDADAPATP